ncbi:ABC transporter permease [Streptomyces sp. 8L]|uniref:ABC transporter permease n=1 Tax=Streptomyces sp. 8L TaxID=2877242 RepID=UPI001CD4247A|nr:ABC transporter permease [Streptomyces sp. 8L]MCA1222605.1 ABC transporter permease [Streptomyces sp. 8L]
MTATTTATPPPTAPKAAGDGKPAGRGKLSVPKILLIVAAALVLVSLVRIVTGSEQLDSEGQIAAALGLAVPIGMAGLAGLWSERAGVVNIGLEGMMILGTFGAGWIGWQTSPWLGLLAGVAFGVLGGLLHAVVTVTFGVDHIVSGVAITLLAQGVTQYLAKLFFNHGDALNKGGNPKQSPPVDSLPQFTVPGVSDGLGSLANHHWFLISDLAGIVGGVFTNLSILTILAAALFALTWLVLWRTSFGLRLRSVGENPVAAESLGVNVYSYKYIGVAISGGLAGFGGAFLAMVSSHFYLEGQTGGRGYIGLAAMIFGNWRPGGLAMGAGLFGFSDALQLRNGGDTVHALLLLLVVLLVLLGVWKAYKKATVQAIVSGAMAALILVWYLLTDSVPDDFVGATPYVVTLLVLSLSAQRLRMPKADGLRYRKGQGS